MPPAHGASIVQTILSDDALRRDGIGELDAMRIRIKSIRSNLATGLRNRWPLLEATRKQEGMFSLLSLSPEEVLRIGSKHGISMPASVAPTSIDARPRCESAPN